MAQLGKYQLVRRIAVGGMAELYLARQSGLEGFEKTVVVKKLLPDHASGEDTVRMFLQEARFAASLAHPNIVQILDLGKVDDDYFIAMEYVEGADLRRCEERAEDDNRPMPFPIVAYVVSCVCRGLHHAHSLRDRDGALVGLVHRDVSPQNVLISKTGEVKLVDFGIAKATNAAAQTQAGLLKGKYAYMSPEQCQGDELDARSDIFSAGILLYELTCRRRLFKRQNEFATMHAVIEQPIAPPSAVSDEVPDELEMIAMRALSRVRDERYSTAEEMQLELQAAIRDNGWEVGPHVLAQYMRELFHETAGSDPKHLAVARPRKIQPSAETVAAARSHDAAPRGASSPPARSAASTPIARASPPVAPPSEIPPETAASLSYDPDDFGDEATVAELGTLAEAPFDLSDNAAGHWGDVDAHELDAHAPATLIGTGMPARAPITRPNEPARDAPAAEVIVPLRGFSAPALAPEPITDAGDDQRVGADTLDDVAEATEIDRDGDLRARVLEKAAADAAAAQVVASIAAQDAADSLMAQIARSDVSPTALPPPTFDRPSSAPAVHSLPVSARPASTRAVATSATARTLTEDAARPAAALPSDVPSDWGFEGIKRSPTEEEAAPTMVALAPTASAPAAVSAHGPSAVSAHAPPAARPPAVAPPRPPPIPGAPAAAPAATPATPATLTTPAAVPVAAPAAPAAVPAAAGASFVPMAATGPSASPTLEVNQPQLRAVSRGARRLAIAIVMVIVAIAGAAVTALVVRSRSRGQGTELSITSIPSGALVFVNGQKRAGVTPMKLVDLAGDKVVHIVLMAEGHQNWQQKLTLAKGAKRTLVAKLVAEATGGKAKLRIVVPPGAKLYVDGEVHGTGSQEILVDSGVAHTIVVKLAGKADATVTIEPMGRGESRTLHITPGKPVERLEPARRGTGGAGTTGSSVDIPRGRAAGIRGKTGHTVPPGR